MTDPLTFRDCVLACYDNPALMSEYRRLTGSDFGATTPLASAIDHATGHFDEQAMRFFAFVYDVVWTRLPPSARRGEVSNG
jgi:hypothetical protein